MNANTKAFVLSEERVVFILRMRMILFLVSLSSKGGMGIWANDFTSLGPLNTTEELCWTAVTFLPSSGFPESGCSRAGRSPETWCNNLGPSQLLAQQMVVPFPQGSPSDALSGLLNAPSCKRAMGGRRKTLTRHTANSRKWKNFYSRKGALHTAPQCQLGLERKDMEKNTDVHCTKV